MSSLPVLISCNIIISWLYPLNSSRWETSMCINKLFNANLNIKVCSSILVCVINFCRLLRCYMVHFRLVRNGYAETVSFQLSAWRASVTYLRAWKRKERATVCDLTNWRQFFMRLSCYWSWISSSHCQSSCGSTRRQPSGSADYFDNAMTKFMINNRTDALKTDINLFFTITNCRIAGSRSLKCRMNFKFMCLSAYWQ